MTKKTARFANTPCYLLKSGNQPIYPTIQFVDPDPVWACVYGFSDKPIYDKFIKSAERLLTPYPLVKGYLTKLIDDADSGGTKSGCLGYVILDAIDPTQLVLQAATLEAVLTAHLDNATQVPVEVELNFDPVTVSYRLKKCDSI